ncbi:MAG TPA: hypothetical protein VF715_06570 [Thermoleophilaceae bacterium]
MSTSSAPDDPERTCPSSSCEPGAKLIGVVGADGTVGYVSPPLEIDADFVERARRGRTPEKRFRFAGPCVEGRCAQWTGSRCGVIDTVLTTPDRPSAPERLPHCGIRSSCRWYAQSGAEACAVCPLVVTDLRES